MILHVSDHHDPGMVNAIWDGLFERGTLTFLRVHISSLMLVAAIDQEPNVEEQMKSIAATVTRLGQRFYPSEAAFPLGEHVL